MSILDVIIYPDGALVACDTQTVPMEDGAGVVGPVSKLYPLVAANAVIAGRGVGAFTSELARLCCFVPGGFDEILAALPSYCEAVHVAVSEGAKAYGITDVSPLDQAEAVLVGYSRQHRRVVGYSIIKAGAGKPFEIERIEAMLMAPGDPEPQYAAGRTGLETVLNLGRAQAAILRKAHGAVAGVSGPLIVATITPQGMTIAKAGELGELRNVAPAVRERAA